MKGLLVRVGIDQAFGGWNAPVDPDDGTFVYVPIPEQQGIEFQSGLGRKYSEVVPYLEKFCAERGVDLLRDFRFPENLSHRYMHLDPDFEALTYGDNGKFRGAGMVDLVEGDILVFYAGLKPVISCVHKLVYALVGYYVVNEVVRACDVQGNRQGENAHTRKMEIGLPDIVVRAKPCVSGRLTRCIPVGEWRNRAYRIQYDILSDWGGLSVNDGYVQRSAVPPSFLDPERFIDWFSRKKCSLLQRNN